MTTCFNGHTANHPGCEGCHYAFHVVSPGRVENGKLIPPEVDGPDGCDFCHKARHAQPVKGCPRCANQLADVMISAAREALPIEEQISMLRMQSWFLGWQSMLAGWLAILGGGSVFHWFRSSGGSQNLFGEFLAIAAVPSAQWFIRQQIKRKSKALPQFAPGGHVIYGEEVDESEMR
ncbi:MAG: hypothetical protein ABR507_04235 [Actinomycetota bacterium]|nr:hypothetical protein [Actinomycetota bacterium]